MVHATVFAQLYVTLSSVLWYILPILCCTVYIINLKCFQIVLIWIMFEIEAEKHIPDVFLTQHFHHGAGGSL